MTTTMDPMGIIVSVIASVGGTGVIVIGLAAWFGQLFATRLQEAYRRSVERELKMLELMETRQLEYIKLMETRQLEYIKSTLEMERLRQGRISETQFQFYTDI